MMTIYKVFYKDYALEKGELMGALAERRKDLRGKNIVESGLKWARSAFGHMVKDEHVIFVVSDELNLKNDTISACGEEGVQ